jgi:hypothetical protein
MANWQIGREKQLGMSWTVQTRMSSIGGSCGTHTAALSGVGGYECRGRNGVAGAKLSEHAIGNAVDVSGLKLVDGNETLGFKKEGALPPFCSKSDL